MTVQAGDTLIHGRKSFIIESSCVGTQLEEAVLELIGVNTIAWTTCCWRGYFGTFVIKNNKLILDKLYVCSNERFKRINNKRPRKSLSNLFYKEYKSAKYKKINCEMKFTGTIRVAEEDKKALFQSVDFSEDCKLYKFKFENGVLKEISEDDEYDK